MQKKDKKIQKVSDTRWNTEKGIQISEKILKINTTRLARGKKHKKWWKKILQNWKEENETQRSKKSNTCRKIKRYQRSILHQYLEKEK